MLFAFSINIVGALGRSRVEGNCTIKEEFDGEIMTANVPHGCEVNVYLDGDLRVNIPNGILNMRTSDNNLKAEFTEGELKIRSMYASHGGEYGHDYLIVHTLDGTLTAADLDRKRDL